MSTLTFGKAVRLCCINDDLVFSSLPQQKTSTLHEPKLPKTPTSSLVLIMYISVFISMCFLVIAITVDAQQCYFPDGSKSNDTLCRPQSSDQASACCGDTNVCLDNGLCLAQIGYAAITRGSCTDPTWQSDGCAQYCQDGEFQALPEYRVCSSSSKLYNYRNLKKGRNAHTLTSQSA